MAAESATKSSSLCGQKAAAKVRRDSQGSLPKTATCSYLDDKATEL
jgi:hypothetical protein